MQINNSRSSDITPLALVTAPERLPAPYKPATTLPVLIEEGGSASQTVLPISDAADTQQARFVREFISSERDVSPSLHLGQMTLMPRPLQLYHMVENITDVEGTKGRVLDTQV